MLFDSDVALIGTGVAPLVAASRLLAEGLSVIILNPEWDFFSEDSELPLDPLWPSDAAPLTLERLKNCSAERALEVLRPDFPGAIEAWPAKEGFRDISAPHVRSRSRLWLQSLDHVSRTNYLKNWEAVEDIYVQTTEAGIKAQILNGLSAVSKFPGISSRTVKAAEEIEGDLKAVLVPKTCDVDVSRYRNGMLEFIQERIGSERMICGASQLDLTSEGVRFHAGGSLKTARLKFGALVYWTPRLTPWVLSQSKRMDAELIHPEGVRLWEEWSLVSSEPLDPSIVGAYEDMAVWAEVEGTPSHLETPIKRLNVLRAGALIKGSQTATEAGNTWASSQSFGALFRLCHEFLKWDGFSVRSMRPRAVFEWRSMHGVQVIRAGDMRARIVSRCDGPLVDAVSAARASCEQLLSEAT